MKPVKIVICGGHFSPALAVVEELVRRNKYKIFYIGSKNVLEGDRVESLEYLTLKKLHIPFYPISCARLQRSFTLFTIPSLIRLPTSFLKSLYILLVLKPDIVLSFGGYVSLPVSTASFLLGIPVVTHEQTHILGLANRIIGRFAKVICLSWSDTQNLSQRKKTVLTGNPIRRSITSPRKSSLVDFGDRNLPLIYISGGSLGSRSINKVVFQILPSLVSRFRVIHQVGGSKGGEDYLSALRRKNELGKALQKNYHPQKHISPEDVGGILHEALFIVGRSGANTLAETAILGKPAIFIPLPWSADDEQEQNAKVLAERKSALIINQDEFTPEKFKKTLEEMAKNISYYAENAQKNVGLFPLDAARQIVDVIDSYVVK